MPMTSKPCPGCGEKPVFRRDSEKVCDTCQQLIEEAQTARARKSRRADVELVRVPFAAYAFPGMSNVWDVPRDTIHGNLFALVELLGSPHTGAWVQADADLVDYSEDRFNRSSPRNWYLPKGFAAIVAQLYQAICDGTDYAFQKGNQKGHSLIVGLASGRTSIDDFNKATVGDSYVDSETEKRTNRKGRKKVKRGTR